MVAFLAPNQGLYSCVALYKKEDNTVVYHIHGQDKVVPYHSRGRHDCLMDTLCLYIPTEGQSMVRCFA